MLESTGRADLGNPGVGFDPNRIEIHIVGTHPYAELCPAVGSAANSVQRVKPPANGKNSSIFAFAKNHSL
jgi:hypothetical protein